MSVDAQQPRAERLRLQLRAEIIDAAAAVFAEHGYHRSGIADIARRLGVGHSTIYAQFPGKRALLDAVMTDAIGKLTTLLVAENGPAAADSYEAYRDQAHRIADAFTAVLYAEPTVVRLLRMLLLEAAGVDDDLARKADAFIQTSARMTAAYLRHGHERGYLRADLDVDATARVLDSMILALAFEQLRTDAPAEQTARLVRAALDLYLVGVRG